MVSHLFFYQLVLVALVWLCLMLQWAWPSDPAACPTTLDPTPSRPKRNRAPQPFEGLINKPPCAACGPATAPRPQAPTPPPLCRAHRARHRVLSRGPGHPGHGASIRSRSQYGAAVAGRGGGAAASLLAALPAWHTGPTSPAR